MAAWFQNSKATLPHRTVLDPVKCSTNACSIQPQRIRLFRAGGLWVADLGPEIGEDHARAAPVSEAPRKDGGRRRAGPEVVQIAPKEPLAPRDLVAASPSGMAPRARDDLLASEALWGTRARLTNAALAAAHPRKAVIKASQAALQAARNGAKTLGGLAASPGGVLARLARIEWRHRRSPARPDPPQPPQQPW